MDSRELFEGEVGREAPMREEGMIERVARAIHNREYEGELGPDGTAEHAMFMDIARAAIEAMREPTPQP